MDKGSLRVCFENQIISSNSNKVTRGNIPEKIRLTSNTNYLWIWSCKRSIKSQGFQDEAVILVLYGLSEGNSDNLLKFKLKETKSAIKQMEGDMKLLVSQKLNDIIPWKSLKLNKTPPFYANFVNTLAIIIIILVCLSFIFCIVKNNYA